MCIRDRLLAELFCCIILMSGVWTNVGMTIVAWSGQTNWNINVFAISPRANTNGYNHTHLILSCESIIQFSVEYRNFAMTLKLHKIYSNWYKWLKLNRECHSARSMRSYFNSAQDESKCTALSHDEKYVSVVGLKAIKDQTLYSHQNWYSRGNACDEWS